MVPEVSGLVVASAPSCLVSSSGLDMIAREYCEASEMVSGKLECYV